MSKPAWREYTAQEVINAIEGSFGIVTAIAKRLGCTRQTVYNYINNCVTVKRALEAERSRHVDLAEAKSLELVKAGDGPQVRFVLSRLGKDRGWVERTEVKPILDDHELDDLIRTELARLTAFGQMADVRTAEGDADATETEG